MLAGPTAPQRIALSMEADTPIDWYVEAWCGEAMCHSFLQYSHGTKNQSVAHLQALSQTYESDAD